MTVRPLEEDLQRLGLSDNEIRRSLNGMGVLEEGEEADFFEDDEEEDFEEAYLSDLAGDDDDSDDEVDESMRVMRMKKGTAKSRRLSKQYYKAHKGKIARKRKQQRKTSSWKRHQKMLARAPKASGARVRRVMSDVELPDSGTLSEGIMGDLSELAESIDRDPKSRFDEYVEAFNYIADLGELLAMRALDEDDDEAASEVLDLSIIAESILKEMEEMGGALTPEEDEDLEEALDEAMEDVAEALDSFGLLAEDDEDFDPEDDLDEDDEDFDEDDDDLDEAKGAPKGKKTKGRKLLTKAMTVKGKSKYKGNTKAQIDLRGDVKRPEGLLSYLKLVKAGVVAPGQKLPKGKKKLNKGALAAKRMAGKGYRGKKGA